MKKIRWVSTFPMHGGEKETTSEGREIWVMTSQIKSPHILEPAQTKIPFAKICVFVISGIFLFIGTCLGFDVYLNIFMRINIPLRAVAQEGLKSIFFCVMGSVLLFAELKRSEIENDKRGAS